jgi:nitrogenase-associated protein
VATVTGERLRSFFGGTPVASWFNAAAPRVKSGAIDPEKVDADGAIALMLAEPLLIRWPLVEVDGEKCAGFDREPVSSLLGGQTPRVDAGVSSSSLEARGLTPLEGCSRPQASAPCPAADHPGKTAHP